MSPTGLEATQCMTEQRRLPVSFSSLHLLAALSPQNSTMGLGEKNASSYHTFLGSYSTLYLTASQEELYMGREVKGQKLG